MPARDAFLGARLRAMTAAFSTPAAVFCIGFAAALAGCATVPVPRLDTQTAPAWRNAAGADANAPAPNLRSWWKAFGDADLDRLVDRALAGNLGLRAAALRIDGARVLARHSGDEFMPQAQARTYAEPTPDSSASYFQVGFDAKWELGLFGRAKATSRVTAAELAGAESDAQAARVSVVAEVVRSYIELRGAQQRLQLLETLATSAAEKTRLTATRQRLRMATAIDAARAESEQAAAQAASYEPRLAIERALQQLAVLTGSAQPDAQLESVAAQPRLGELRIASVPADLLRTRPEIRRAEADVIKSAGELGIARADLYPRVGLGGSLTYAARVIGHTRLSDADGIVTFGPAIDIPLFDWGARRAAADARDLQLRAQVLAYRQSVLEGVAEAEGALAALERQRERCAALGRGLSALERADASARRLGALGLADGFDRVSAQAALAQARLDVAQAEQERSIAFVALYKALGGAPPPDQARNGASPPQPARSGAALPEQTRGDAPPPEQAHGDARPPAQAFD